MQFGSEYPMDPSRGEGTVVPPGEENQQGPEGNPNDVSADNKSAENTQTTKENTGPHGLPKVSSSTCKPVAAHRPEVELPSHRINARIQFMRDHALIGKFMGF